MLRIQGFPEALSPLRAPMPTGVAVALPGGQTVLACGDTSLALVVGI